MSRKRIVLSDEEDDDNNDNELDLGETASAKKLTESIHQMKVTDSASKPPRYQSVRKKLFDGENESDNETKNFSARSGTSRTQALSSKKETERAKAVAEINRFRSKGLNAINFDESEEEDDFTEEDDIEQFIIEEDEENDELAIDHESKRSKKRLDIFSAPKKAPRNSSSNEKYSSRPSMSISKRNTPSSSAMKAFTEYRGNQERDDENYASDLDDFIVADDEEEEEQESREESENEAEFEVGTTTAINGDERSQESDLFDAGNFESAQKSKSPPSKPSKSKSNSNRKSIVLSDNEDDEKMTHKDEESMPQISKSTQKRRVRRTLFTASDDEELSGNEEEEAEDEDDDGEDNENDGPLLYWKLNAQMDEAEDGSEDYDDAALAGQLFSMNQKFTLEQAFALYLQFLGKTLVSPKFRQQVANRTLPRQKLTMYEKAARQVENLICTHRESLLGSSAWQGDFLHELQHRPFYMCPQSGSCKNGSGGLCGDGEQRCAACGRMAKEAFFSVYLYGPSYEGMVIWSQNKWIQSLPTCMFLQPGDEDSESDEDFVSEKNSSKNKISGKKRSRSSRYISYDDAVEAAEQSAVMVVGDEDVDNEEDDDDEEFAGEHHRHKKNKQYSAFQQKNQPSLLPSALKTPASVATDASSTSLNRKRSRADSEMMQEEDDVDLTMQDNERDSSHKKRRVVILSDSEHEKDDKSMQESSVYRKTPAKSTSTSGSPSKWWNKALPRALNQEAESRWELSLHCKNRTNLYHTLLHYKFRLILKIRENLQKLHSRNSDHVYSGYALEDLPCKYVEELLAELLDSSKRSKSFVSQETDRLQVLLRTAEKRYGGDKFESAAADIWGSETLSTNDKISSSFASNASSSASSSKTPSSTTMRQLKLIKKDFRSTVGNGNMLIMGEPRRPTIQSRLSSWLTPKN